MPRQMRLLGRGAWILARTHSPSARRHSVPRRNEERVGAQNPAVANHENGREVTVHTSDGLPACALVEDDGGVNWLASSWSQRTSGAFDRTQLGMSRLMCRLCHDSSQGVPGGTRTSSDPLVRSYCTEAVMTW